MSRQSDMQRVLDAAQRAGLRLEKGRKHLKLKNAAGKVVVISSSPSDNFAWRQVWRDIRRVFGLSLDLNNHENAAMRAARDQIV